MGSAAFITETPVRAPSRRMRTLGCRVFDDSGEPSIDFDMGGGAVVLGHSHLVVEAAVADPPSDAEALAASELLALLPAAEAVRFTAEESQALPAAIAAARRVTGRRRVLAWTLGTPIAAGDDLAAVVVDPLGASPAGLAAARQVAGEAGAVLIFDEAWSGFRVHEQGAQGLSGVTADLCVHGSAIANGRAIGAIAGQRELVAALDENDLRAPRPTALAAAAATLHVLADTPVAPQLRVLGAELQAEVARIVEASGAERFFSLDGDPTLPAPLFAAPQLEGLWLREMANAGLVALGPHALCADHGEPEVARLIGAYAHIIPAMTAKGLLEALLRRLPPTYQ